MMSQIQRVVDRVLNRFQRQPSHEEADQIIQAIRESESPTACHVCGRQGCVQVSAPRPSDGEVRAAYLCYDDLGAFLELFTDPAITEFTVVRL